MPFDGTSLSQVKRDLLAARELLIEKGWVPHAKSDGPYCIGMALFVGVCARDHERTEAAYEPLKATLGLTEDADYPLFDWNDAQTSIGPVLALLDKAIAAA